MNLAACNGLRVHPSSPDARFRALPVNLHRPAGPPGLQSGSSVPVNPELVYEWLRAVGVTDLPEWDPAGDLKLGAHILESAAPFGKYFSDLKPGPANTYRYVYTRPVMSLQRLPA